MSLPDYRQPQSLQNACLDWQQNTPLAPAFGDVYFSREQGLAESRYVFLQHNRLPERWLNWQQQRAFVMGETGFGTGLNFLLAAHTFLQTAPSAARLHWISTELQPLTAEDLRQAHQHWPELADMAALLQAVYPLPVSGFHRLHPHPRITLDLLLGDAASNLAVLQGQVDAWCLDGFAPDRNPHMWSESLFAALARTSHPHTTLATFTCAGQVRRGLQAAGFSLQKVPGFGRKREMLCGQFAGNTQPQASTPWFHCPAPQPVQKLAIIGAGLAGLATAEALARRGIQADIFEAESTAGTQGSGNRQGVLYVKLAVEMNPASRFFLNGLEYSRRWLQRLDPQQHYWSAAGVLQLAKDPQESVRQKRFLQCQQLPEDLVQGVDAAAASQMAGSAVQQSGLYYPRAGWVRPGDLCRHLASGHPLICQQRIAALHRKDDGWQLVNAQHQPLGHYSQVILCQAAAARQLLQAATLPIKPLRGQVSQLNLPADAPTLPQCVVCGSGYVSPAWQGQLCFGATYDVHSQETALRTEDHRQNLQELQQLLPELGAQLNVDWQQPVQGKVGFRCTSPDYLPLVGPLPDAAAWLKHYAPLQHNAAWLDAPKGVYHTGLWINLAHGSRGLASIPLSAELLVSQMLGEPAPFEQPLVEALHPGRFLIRQLKRRQ